MTTTEKENQSPSRRILGLNARTTLRAKPSSMQDDPTSVETTKGGTVVVVSRGKAAAKTNKLHQSSKLVENERKKRLEDLKTAKNDLDHPVSQTRYKQEIGIKIEEDNVVAQEQGNDLANEQAVEDFANAESDNDTNQPVLAESDENRKQEQELQITVGVTGEPESKRISIASRGREIKNLNYLKSKKEIEVSNREKESALAEKQIELQENKLSTASLRKQKEKTIVSTNGNEKILLEEEQEAESSTKNKKAVKYFNKYNPTANRKLSASQIAQFDTDDTSDIEDSRRSRGVKKAKKQSIYAPAAEKIVREVEISETITVQELANRMAVKGTDVIKALIKLGVMANLNQIIDADTAEMIIEEFGHKSTRVSIGETIKNLLAEPEENLENMEHRPPVVTIMGHVDHGKTSLLDALHSTDVTAGEHGGITQHIGAYHVTLANGKSITFLDTPGHEAFTAMRMRGAQVTDIVVLVVAANDGIKAQTIEAISHAKAANVPIIVAVNKMDLPDANFDAVKTSLFSHDLVPDDMGGDVIVIGVSAQKGLGLDKLEEAILMQAELLDLKANPNRFARGRVIESKIDKNKGVSVTFLVQKGTLRVGDIVVAGTHFGRIKAMIDDKGKNLKQAIPSMPVEILGLSGVPTSGDEFAVMKEERDARAIAELKATQERENRMALATKPSVTLEQLFANAKNSVKELKIIVKADVKGSVEAIVQSLQKIENKEVVLRVLLQVVGGVSESDVMLAAASNAIIIGFNVRATPQVKQIAEKLGVDIRYYSIIYNLIDDVKNAMSGLLSPITKENILGSVSIRQVFEVSKIGKIAGCYVTEGLVKRGSHIRVLRDSIVIHDGKMKSLRRAKDDVREVKQGFECGIVLESYHDIKEGDVLEVYEMVQEKQQL